MNENLYGSEISNPNLTREQSMPSEVGFTNKQIQDDNPIMRGITKMGNYDTLSPQIDTYITRNQNLVGHRTQDNPGFMNRIQQKLRTSESIEDNSNNESFKGKNNSHITEPNLISPK